MKDKEFEREIKTISMVKLYELGKVSSGIAAKLLNLTRIEFLKLLAYYNVFYIASSEEELDVDFKNA